MKFTIDITGAIKKTRTLKNIPRASRLQLERWAGVARKQIIRNISGPIVGRYEGGVKTGKLRRSIKHSITIFGQEYRLEIGSEGTKYARILEKGGRIYPRRRKFLTIPFKGVKGTAPMYRLMGKTFVYKSKRGKLLIAQKKGRGLTFLFILKKMVKIPPFRWLEQSIDQKRPLLDRLMRADELYKVAGRI